MMCLSDYIVLTNSGLVHAFISPKDVVRPVCGCGCFLAGMLEWYLFLRLSSR